jgi:hypothetical protein
MIEDKVLTFGYAVKTFEKWRGLMMASQRQKLSPPLNPLEGARVSVPAHLTVLKTARSGDCLVFSSKPRWEKNLLPSTRNGLIIPEGNSGNN